MGTKYFINVWMEVDSTSNPNTINDLRACGNLFDTHEKAIEARQAIITIIHSINTK